MAVPMFPVEKERSDLPLMVIRGCISSHPLERDKCPPRSYGAGGGNEEHEKERKNDTGRYPGNIPRTHTLAPAARVMVGNKIPYSQKICPSNVNNSTAASFQHPAGSPAFLQV